MQRNFLKTLLENYWPTHIEEQVAKRQMLEFLDACKDCFERSCRIGHFTASSWLTNADCTKVLLTHHKKLNRWFQLGGHCDGDANVIRVAIKEAREESGIDRIVPLQEDIFDLDVHLIPQIQQEPPHYHFDIRFLLKVDGPDTVTISPESKALEWFSSDAKKFPTADTSVLRMLNKWKHYRETLLI